ncbi:DinB family protein [Angustibacter peucedani]
MPTPRVDPPIADPEVSTLRGFLDYHRDTLRMKTDGLDAAGLAAVHPPSTLTLGGLLKHAALNDDWWFCRVLEGRETEPDWVPAGAFEQDEDWELSSARDDSPEELRRIFDTSRAGADAAIDRALAKDGLDTLSVVTSPSRGGQAFTLRWVLLHMIEEYARHNGHADLLREAVDGTVGE